jgi:hypothetical protein
MVLRTVALDIAVTVDKDIGATNAKLIATLSSEATRNSLAGDLSVGRR